MFPYFVVLDTNYDSITSLLATQILYFGPLRGVMKIRIAVTLVVLGLLHTYIHWLPKTSKMREAITPEPL